MSSSPQAFSRPFPQWRRLRGYAFDPGLSQQFETAGINKIVFRVPWEKLEAGPIGEYLSIVDYDPASECFYAPVNLDDPVLVGSDGEKPNESNPQFHQQFVYAVAMTTIHNFERALGRKVLWSPRRDETKPPGQWESFVRRLRIYPHAFRGANAYYSPQKKALLFGYFPASAGARGAQLPGGLVFTCLSHDIVAHETTHALLDATWPNNMVEASNPDLLAFHEAFADIVALFQHFSYPEVLQHQIARTRGDLASQSLLGQLAQQFGQATGSRGGLREAIGTVNEQGRWELLQPDPKAYEELTEPHERGALLVAAIFDAFLTIYRSRAADLLRLASGGSGVLPAGALPPDLTNRLTREAAKTAQHVLTMCIRALDYCPPVDVTFGDYLRAILTADADLMPDDDHFYRVAFIEAFRKRGMYPRELRTLSEETLRWPRGEALDEKAKQAVRYIADQLRDLQSRTQYQKTRGELFDLWREWQERIHEIILHKMQGDILGNFEELTGLAFEGDMASGLTAGNRPSFEVHSIRPARRRGPQGEEVNQVIVGITQRRNLNVNGESLRFHGGCTLILDLNTLELRYAISKSIADKKRENQFRKWMGENPTAAALTSLDADVREPIAHLHLTS